MGTSISDNGFHLNKRGYYHLVAILETELGLPENGWSIEIDVDKNALDATTAAKLTQVDPKKKHLKFTVEEKYLPLPLDEEGAAAGLERILKIQGLGKGYFVLETDGRQVASASAKEWANGVNIRQGPLFEQARELQTWINRKDGVFLRQYRPQNRTYIVGFRSYEQGRHLKDLEDMDIILAWLDGQINSSKKPKASTYELKPIR
jgi:hypothetical protein